MDEQHRRLQRSRQICKQNCCCFIDGRSVSLVQYVLSRKGQGRELASFEAEIPCLNLPETQARIEQTAVYMGIPMGKTRQELLKFPIFIFHGKTHQFVRDATVKEYEQWGLTGPTRKPFAIHN
jgi:hypothetical protein